ncbi:MAG: Nif3-like dinuclear metal center hexameric protein, partial [Defluviitaleaceae bacterium]|nr:Nif3-like dinuclear metal center hexameric protein [Defluviitaleaceae bacterium]
MNWMIQDVIRAMEELAPPDLAQEWDNIGLLLGRHQAPVAKILIALDATAAVVEEAMELEAELIITHHPLTMSGMKRINDSNPLGRRVMRLLENKIALYCAHTNLDAAKGGINDILFERLGLNHMGFFAKAANGAAFGRIGLLEKEMTLADFANFVKNCLGLTHISFCGEIDTPIHKVAVSSGSSASPDYFREIRSLNVDVFVTADIKFHAAQEALDLGLALIDATHYASEAIFADPLKAYLSEKLPNL